MPHFDVLKIYSCGKYCKKRRIACNNQFLLFSQCFLPYMAIVFHFKMLSAICLNLDQSKILWSGKVLIVSYPWHSFDEKVKTFPSKTQRSALELAEK